jgi:hypothetical protein
VMFVYILKATPRYCFLFFFSFGTAVWNQGPHLDPLHQPFCVEGFSWDRVLRNYWPGLTSNCSTPELCLLSSWDDRREPPASRLMLNFSWQGIYRTAIESSTQGLNSPSQGSSPNSGTKMTLRPNALDRNE